MVIKKEYCIDCNKLSRQRYEEKCYSCSRKGLHFMPRAKNRKRLGE